MRTAQDASPSANSAMKPGGGPASSTTSAKRNARFHPAREPQHPRLRLARDPRVTTGPVSFLNPTVAHFHFHHSPPPGTSAPAAAAADDKQQPWMAFKWTARNNRKGRHALLLLLLPAVKTTTSSSTPWKKVGVLGGLARMATRCPVHDVSYAVAALFTLGSVVWVLNAFFVWLPLQAPGSAFAGEILYGGGVTAFVGATIFELGSVLLLLEAVNEHRGACFGGAVEGVEAGGAEEVCAHHHANRRNLVVGHGRRRQALGDGEEKSSAPRRRRWTWIPTAAELRTHYLYELGFLASAAQLLAASVFWIAGFAALPGIYDNMGPLATTLAYWNPQVVGGAGFVVSGLLFTLETQTRWWQPALGTLGWWIGAWNTVGGVGFTLCPAFGYDDAAWAQYQAALSTFWGSWAFLVGSVVQWYESLEKYPVETVKTPG
ncbi:hypothetical protein F4780DRAFT_736513 [Xylariomycetidae sp. FL0641]|nr:hypothetical protein F4780DRAFT_736513 [Xylariomycetidae sp. FL0641]